MMCFGVILAMGTLSFYKINPFWGHISFLHCYSTIISGYDNKYGEILEMYYSFNPDKESSETLDV